MERFGFVDADFIYIPSLFVLAGISITSGNWLLIYIMILILVLRAVTLVMIRTFYYLPEEALDEHQSKIIGGTNEI